MAQTIQDALGAAAGRLSAIGVDSPRLDAELLLGAVVGLDRVGLITRSREELRAEDAARFEELLTRREQLEPVAYLLGKQEFYGREFRVRAGTLIPRPETEHLIEAVLGMAQPGDRVVDLGVGSGAICVTLALELGSVVTGVDVDRAPLELTTENAAALGARVQLVQADWLSAVRARVFDLVVSNPPYIPLDDAEVMPGVKAHEPALALWGGADGLDHYRTIERQAREVLRPGGRVALELGPVEVAEVFAGWKDVRVLPDLAGRPRVLTAILAD